MLRVIREPSPSSSPSWPLDWPRWEVSSQGSWSCGWAWGWPKGRTLTRQVRSPDDRLAQVRLACRERNRDAIVGSPRGWHDEWIGGAAGAYEMAEDKTQMSDGVASSGTTRSKRN